jgi:hypothetical protein
MKRAVKRPNSEVKLGGKHSKQADKQIPKDNSFLMKNEKRLQIRNKHKILRSVRGWWFFL